MPTQREIRTTLIKFYNQPVAKVSLELFLSIGAVIFFAAFAIRPTLLTMSDLIKEIEDKTTLNEQLGQKSASLATAQTQYLNLKDRLLVLDQSLPSQPEFEQTLKIIEKIASDNQLIISSVQVNEIPKEAEPTVPFSQKKKITVPISVSVTGDYLTIRNFVENIHNNRRTLIVDSIIFSVSEINNSKKLKANITVNMQYFGVESTADKK